MKNNIKNKIISIEKNSIAEEVGIVSGDILLSINDFAIKDVFDYRYFLKDEYIEVLIGKPDDTQIIYEIEKDEDEDMGIVFENGLIDNAKSCKNNCIFCFIDQLPPNMRETLYFKDDDSRLSFLQGNYVTLTNMSEEDLERIIFYHLSPINISVHSTNLKIRKFMLKNPNSDNLSKYLDMLYKANTEMNFQIVLCKGQNDGKNLDDTIKDLSQYMPQGRSLSVVPVGITKYRDKLFPLEPFTKEDSLNIISQLDNWNKKFREEHDTSFVYASDEFYLKSGLSIPDTSYYEDFPQIENGVGMLSLFRDESMSAISQIKGKPITEKISIVTGVLAYEFIKEIINTFKNIFPNTEIEIFPITNIFFGSEITVTGLLTGQDILSTLKNKDLGQKILIPQNTLKSDENIFLDDFKLVDLEKELNTLVKVVKVSGDALVRELLQ